MVETCAVLCPVLYDSADLPESINPDESKNLVEIALNTGWRVRFYKLFEYKNVVYERYIFEREVK